MRAAAMICSLVTGLTFCGMVLDPPRPSSAVSRTSPISVCARRMTSCAILARLPLTSDSQPATSASVSRCVCHGSGGVDRPSSAASASATSTPRSPSGSSVPAAPPSCTASTRGLISASRVRWRRRGASHPAALSPNGIGTACWECVRPGITDSR